MRAALVVAGIAVRLGEVDAATVFEIAGDATGGSTVGNLVGTVQALASLLAAVFRHGSTVEEAVVTFEHALPILATQIAPPPDDYSEGEPCG